MQAWREADGRYALIDEGLRSETYPIRGRIKQLGGIWDPERRHWTVPAEAVDKLGAARVYGVFLAPYCHHEADFRFVSQRDLDRGAVRGPFCGYCDSRSGSDVPIVECYGEPPEARSLFEAEFRGRPRALTSRR